SRRRHTRSYGDWSSDVCSSDLEKGGSGSSGLGVEKGLFAGLPLPLQGEPFRQGRRWLPAEVAAQSRRIGKRQALVAGPGRLAAEIGRASGRERGERGGWGWSVM